MSKTAKLHQPRRKTIPWDDAEGPALPVSLEHARALAHAAVDTSLRPAPTSRRVHHGVLLAAAALFFAAVVFAALSVREAAPPKVAPPEPRPEVPSGAPVAVLEPVIPSNPEVPKVAEEVTPITKSKGVRAPMRTATPEADADDLLKLANTFRRQRAWSDAAKTYEKVIALAPGSGKAYVARTAAASLRFEHLDDPRGALALYRAANEQEPRGPLSEEVLWGIADCHRALGDPDAEARALRAFVAAHPESLMRVQADNRLSTLGR